MPNDGEPLNVASLRQNEKVLADFAAWAAAPKAVSGNWADPAWYAQNARGQRRFLVDHMGYPSGKVYSVTEYWRGREQLLLTGSHAFEKTVHRWSGLMTATAGQGIDTTVNPGNLILGIGSGSGDTTQLTGDAFANFVNAQGASMEFRLTNIDASIATHKIMAGWIAPSFGLPFNTPVGAYFFKAAANANWQAICGDGVALTTVDTGVAVAVTTPYDMRVEWLGSAVSDDAAVAARFYINDVLKASITSGHLPSGSGNLDAGPFFGAKDDGGAAAHSWVVGPTRLSANWN
jgi:hypothetical protein